jgi:endogenous inhibitor of DNA gyrase (YacG/DUF329 family)
MSEIDRVRVVKCPSCSGNSIYASTNPYRPFCSARCKNHDLGAWANEEHRLPEPTPPDDMDLPSSTPIH